MGDIAENFPRILLGDDEGQGGGPEAAKMWLMENYGEIVGNNGEELWGMLMESAFTAMQKVLETNEEFKEHYNP
jgi:hypothetical protein